MNPPKAARPGPRVRRRPYAADMQVRHHDEANATQRAVRRLVSSRPGAWVSRRTLYRLDLFAHRIAPSRRPPSQWVAAVPVGLLTTTGARTGEARTVPLLVVPLEDGWGVVASRYGSTRPPAWYFNLRAHPKASLEVDGVVHRVRAEQVQGTDRERVRQGALDFYRGYTAYEERAGGRDL